MDITQGNLGPEAKYEIDIIAGKVIAQAEYNGSQLQAGSFVKLDLVAILEIVKVKIPGTIDDAIISIVQAAIAAQEAPKPE